MSFDPNLDYLSNDQYRDSSNLDARIALHERFSTNRQGWFPWVFETLAELPQQARVLELGCGQGNLWRTNVARIPKTWTITLSDLSEGMLQTAWRNLVANASGRAFKYKQIDAQAIPYPDESFEIVIANHMLYHVPERTRALQEIRRILTPGGWLVATTVGENHIRELDGWTQQVYQGSRTRPSSSFTLGNGLEQLKTVFEQVEVRSYPNQLHVTEAAPLIAYIRSNVPSSHLSEPALEQLKQNLEAELLEKPALFITIDTGLFLAQK
jgi:ubiquinone/menaquinone biosynthesis C-methylase UbiE